MKKNPFSSWTVVALLLVFAWTVISDASHSAKSGNNCVASYDAFGYYAYLPAVLKYDDIRFEKDWVKESQDNCGAPLYQFDPQENGNLLDIYHMGLAYVQLPGFLIADACAESFGYPANGLSFPYELATRITLLLFVVLGLVYLRKLLLLFFDDRITALTLLLTLLASNVFITFRYSQLMPHAYLFACNAIFLYYLVLFTRTRHLRFLVISALILGLTTAIRPTQAIWGIIPFVLLFFDTTNRWRTLLLLMLYPASILLFNLPQLFYWKFIGGHWFVLNMHSESLSLGDPYTWKFLFSFRKGWLIYSPVFFFAIIGAWRFRKTNRRVANAFILFAILNIYVLSSWECWYYAGSYGSRVMTDSYALWAVFMAAFLSGIRFRRKSMVFVAVLSLFFITLNFLQSYQFLRGIIHGSRMTFAHYVHVLGRTHYPESDFTLLEIDRESADWVEQFQNPASLAFKRGYRIHEKELFPVKGDLNIAAEQEFTPLYDFTGDYMANTDDVAIHLSFKPDFDSLNGPAYFVFTVETSKKPYFYYAPDFTMDNGGTYTASFTMPERRHPDDRIKIYIWNPNKDAGKLRDFSLRLSILDRKP